MVSDLEQLVIVDVKMEAMSVSHFLRHGDLFWIFSVAEALRLFLGANDYPIGIISSHRDGEFCHSIVLSPSGVFLRICLWKV
jgi:hypothetical protein